MREPERIERILNLIKIIWSKHPDMRYGQLYDSLLTTYLHNKGEKFSYFNIERTMWNLEDAEFEQFLSTFTEFA